MRRFATALAAYALTMIGGVSAGDLEPAAPPAPTPGPEPRIAINSVNTPGDDDSIFRITDSGSYYLEDNLSIFSFSQSHGIEVAASDVTIDLNGFGIFRSVIVVPIDPEPQGGAVPPFSGIIASEERASVRVMNGHLRGWSGSGIDLTPVMACSVTDVTSRNNSSNGIEVGRSSNVVNCTAFANGSRGILVGRDSVVRGCTATSNTNDGIESGDGSLVTECVASENGADGIEIENDGVITNCNATGNAFTGIQVINKGHIAHCRAERNGDDGIASSADAHILNCTAIGNGGSGIRHTGGGMVANCSSSSNDEHGIEISFGSASVVNNNCVDHPTGSGIDYDGNNGRIDGNFVSDCLVGINVVGSENVVTRNVGQDNTDDFDFFGSNDVATVQTDVNSAGPWDNMDL